MFNRPPTHGNPDSPAIALALPYIGINWLITQAVFLHDPSLDDPLLSPRPIWSWQREIIVDNRDGSYLIDYERVGDCRLPDLTEARRTNSQLDAFLFWSRAPFATRAPDGSVMLYDARFYDPRARDRFSVALPDVNCEPLPLSSP